MTVEQVCRAIKDQNAPYIRVLDTNNRLLFSIEDSDNVEQSVEKLESTLPIFESYGRVKIMAATESKFKQQYKGCLHYDCVLSAKTTGNAAVVAQQQTQGGNLLELVKVMQVLQVIGNSNNNNNNAAVEVMRAEMAAMRKEFEWERKLAEMEKKNSDPTKYFAMFGPAAMRMAGMKSEEVKETLMLTQMSMAAANGTTQTTQQKVAGTGATLTTNVRTIPELQKLSNDQKNAEIENLMQELSKKVSAEEILLILEIVNAKPELVEKVINLHNSGVI